MAQEHDSKSFYDAIKSNNLEMADYLLNHQMADINFSCLSESGNRPLHAAVINNNPEAVSYLIALGANVHLKNSDNKSPLDLAIENKTLNNMDALWTQIDWGISIPALQLRLKLFKEIASFKWSDEKFFEIINNTLSNASQFSLTATPPIEFEDLCFEIGHFIYLHAPSTNDNRTKYSHALIFFLLSNPNNANRHSFIKYCYFGLFGLKDDLKFLQDSKICDILLEDTIKKFPSICNWENVHSVLTQVLDMLGEIEGKHLYVQIEIGKIHYFLENNSAAYLYWQEISETSSESKKYLKLLKGKLRSFADPTPEQLSLIEQIKICLLKIDIKYSPDAAKIIKAQNKLLTYFISNKDFSRAAEWYFDKINSYFNHKDSSSSTTSSSSSLQHEIAHLTDTQKSLIILPEIRFHLNTSIINEILKIHHKKWKFLNEKLLNAILLENINKIDPSPAITLFEHDSLFSRLDTELAIFAFLHENIFNKLSDSNKTNFLIYYSKFGAQFFLNADFLSKVNFLHLFRSFTQDQKSEFLQNVLNCIKNLDVIPVIADASKFISDTLIDYCIHHHELTTATRLIIHTIPTGLLTKKHQSLITDPLLRARLSEKCTYLMLQKYYLEPNFLTKDLLTTLIMININKNSPNDVVLLIFEIPHLYLQLDHIWLLNRFIETMAAHMQQDKLVAFITNYINTYSSYFFENNITNKFISSNIINSLAQQQKDSFYNLLLTKNVHLMNEAVFFKYFKSINADLINFVIQHKHYETAEYLIFKYNPHPDLIKLLLFNNEARKKISLKSLNQIITNHSHDESIFTSTIVSQLISENTIKNIPNEIVFFIFKHPEIYLKCDPAWVLQYFFRHISDSLSHDEKLAFLTHYINLNSELDFQDHDIHFLKNPDLRKKLSTKSLSYLLSKYSQDFGLISNKFISDLIQENSTNNNPNKAVLTIFKTPELFLKLTPEFLLTYFDDNISLYLSIQERSRFLFECFNKYPYVFFNIINRFNIRIKEEIKLFDQHQKNIFYQHFAGHLIRNPNEINLIGHLELDRDEVIKACIDQKQYALLARLTLNSNHHHYLTKESIINIIELNNYNSDINKNLTIFKNAYLFSKLDPDYALQYFTQHNLYKYCSSAQINAFILFAAQNNFQALLKYSSALSDVALKTRFSLMFSENDKKAFVDSARKYLLTAQLYTHDITKLLSIFGHTHFMSVFDPAFFEQAKFKNASEESNYAINLIHAFILTNKNSIASPESLYRQFKPINFDIILLNNVISHISVSAEFDDFHRKKWIQFLKKLAFQKLCQQSKMLNNPQKIKLFKDINHCSRLANNKYTFFGYREVQSNFKKKLNKKIAIEEKLQPFINKYLETKDTPKQKQIIRLIIQSYSISFTSSSESKKLYICLKSKTSISDKLQTIYNYMTEENLTTGSLRNNNKKLFNTIINSFSSDQLNQKLNLPIRTL
jgi:hypothetical protein